MIALTESGRTALMMSRLSSGLPIFALSRNESTLNRAALYRGVTPVYFDANAMRAYQPLKPQFPASKIKVTYMKVT
ncbi:pyruvate kinase alpha/beta domain-containing protein [Vibrio parahaemolyticus]|nr:pyruvate kinase alpha/beta domain-containing protein [Vibrio parahaemolyticus]